MSDQPDVEERLEAVLGYKPDKDALAAIRLIQTVAHITEETNSTAVLKDLVLAGPNTCNVTFLLDFDGVGITGNDGRSVFRLNDFRCRDVDRPAIFFQPVNFVATPLSSSPRFVTVVHSLVDNGQDVEFRVFAWDANGAPAPRLSFGWRCRVELASVT